MQENVLDEKKKKPRLKSNPWLVLIDLRATGPRTTLTSTITFHLLMTTGFKPFTVICDTFDEAVSTKCIWKRFFSLNKWSQPSTASGFL